MRDQNVYITERRQLEDWLRGRAEENGVRIDKQTPVYFAFEKDPAEFLDNFARQQEMRFVHFHAREIDLSNWSFTFSDHFFGNYHQAADPQKIMEEMDAHPLHGQVLNAAQLLDALKEHGYPEHPLHKIEAQMWASEPTFLAAPRIGLANVPAVPEAGLIK